MNISKEYRSNKEKHVNNLDLIDIISITDDIKNENFPKLSNMK